MQKPRFLNLGDRALTLEFGETIDPELVSLISAFDRLISEKVSSGDLAGVIETVPTYRSLTVIFDPLRISRSDVQSELAGLLVANEEKGQREERHWRFPVCYGGEFGPDLEKVAETKALTTDQVIDLHVSNTYLVYMIGFMPGFPFMGDVAPELGMPRLREPRVRVPAGSVAMIGQQTAIYPWESPGGWQLLGRCPISLFDANREKPALLAPGDRVSFHSVSEDEFAMLKTRESEGALDYSELLLTQGDA